MQVNESNGEVSASIQETNRVRALLGLKPLNVCPIRPKNNTGYPFTNYHYNPSLHPKQSQIHNKNTTKINKTHIHLCSPSLSLLQVGSSSSSSSSNHNKHNDKNNKIQKESSSKSKPSIDTQAIEKLHEKLQHKHRLQATVRGISLAEELIKSNNFDNFSAEDWVKKSRQLEKKQKLEQKQTAQKMKELYDDEEEEQEDQEQDNGSSHLKNKIVNHDINAFKKGETKILILKDRRILDDKLEIDNDEDELINVELYEQEMRENKQDEIENIKRNRKYNPFDDENNNILLPQYEQRDPTKNKHSFILNEEGNKIIAELQRDQVENDDGDDGMNGNKERFKEYDLMQERNKIESDYVIKFKKKKKKKKKDKKKKKRKRDDDDEMNGNGKDAKKRKIDLDGDVPIELRQEAMEDKYAFLGDGDGDNDKSRGRRDEILNALKAAEIEEEEEKERLNRYNMALYRANKSMQENLKLNEMINALGDGDESDNDDIFRNNLQRAEILQTKQNDDKQQKDQQQTNETKKQSGNINIEEEGEGEEEEEEDEDGVVFTIATQFSDGLSSAMTEMAEENDIFMNEDHGEYDIENAIIVDTKHNETDDEDDDDDIDMNKNNDGGWIDVGDGDNNQRNKAKNKNKKRNKNKNNGKNNDDNNNNDDILDSSILDREPLCGRSLSDTLSHIRRRGYFQDDEIDIDINKNKHFKPAHIGILNKRKIDLILNWDIDDVLRWLRRSNDKLYIKYNKNFRIKRINGQKLISSCGSSEFLRGVIGMKNGHLDISKFLSILGELKGDPAPDITLSHEDEYGKPMTAKEAFRKLSHKFHGKKSGPKKQEKRLKKRNEQLLRKKMNNIDTPLGTLEKLKQTTKTLNKPFVVLDKN